MQGIYKINDQEHKNIITQSGKLAILNNIAGRRSGFCSTIVVGIGTETATVDDTTLNFVTGGSTITTTIVDSVNEKIYFKTTLPSTDQYSIYELGCFSSRMDRQQSGSLLFTFGELSQWVDVEGTSTIDNVDNRIGTSALKYTLTASASCTGKSKFVSNLSQLSDSTQFKLAYMAHNLTSVLLRFKVDDSNYYEASYPVTEGYDISYVLKNNFTATGSPNWTNINYIEVSAIANGSGGYIVLDGCRYDAPASVQSGELLSRTVLLTPQKKLIGVTMDIEYELDLAI